MFKILLSTFLVFFSLSVFCHEEEILFNRINLQASAQRDIPNDKMVVVMSVEHQGEKATSVSADVNRDMEWALQQLQQQSDINAKTQSYQTAPVYNKKTIVAWRTVQTLKMESINIAALTDIVGKLQKKMLVKQITFMPSQDARRGYENELITEAIRAFYKRVDIVRLEMESKNVRIIELNISTSADRKYYPMQRETMMLASVQSAQQPAMESGTSNIQVTINGSIQFY